MEESQDARDGQSSTTGKKQKGIIAELAKLPPGTLIYMPALCRIFRRKANAIRDGVRRGDLPPPTRLFGKPTWTSDGIARHVEARLAEAAKTGPK